MGDVLTYTDVIQPAVFSNLSKKAHFSRPIQLRPPETGLGNLREYLSVDFLGEDTHRL